MTGETAILTGKQPTDLGNEISDVIHKYLSRGMETDEVCSIVVKVAADYARGEYGNAYLKDLRKVIDDARNKPMPERAFK